MADIGVLPTKTSVNIISSTGENGRLEAATAQQAGCMSAEQAKQLDALWLAHHTADGGALVIQAPQRSDMVSRQDLRAAVAEMQRLMSSNMPAALPAHSLSDRLEQIETALSAPPLPDASMSERVSLLEGKVKQIATALDVLCGEVDRLSSGQTFIEKHALASIDVKQVTQ